VTHRGQAGSQVSPGGLTCTIEIRFMNAERATVMPRNKPALYSNPVSPGCFFGCDAGTENLDSVNEALG